MSNRSALLVGAGAGLVIGLVISIASDVPLAPEVGVLLGLLGGWLYGRKSA